MDQDNGFKAFFIRGLVLLAVAIVFLFVGVTLTLGILSVINKVSPSDLIKGDVTGEEQASGEKQADEEQQNIENEISTKNETAVKEEEVLLKNFNSAISRIVEKIIPSVVNIRVTVQMQDIFGHIYEQEGVGSGVIYTEDGYIITNNHVAGDAEKLVVTLYDGTNYLATLIGADERTDVAVIKIEADNLNVASFTSIESAKVGDIVIAVGSPFGLDQTVTMGVISAKGRDITIPVNLIQTDAAINPGNSGGPLVNSNGEVIVINTLAATGTSNRFAIPSNTVVNIAKQIIEYGRARIPYMGVEMAESTTDVIGVYINSVIKGYPAEKAGIKVGDVIVEMDGVKVSNPYELFAQILKHDIGDEVTVKLYRNGEYLTVTPKLVEAPAT